MMGHKICFYGNIWIIIPNLSLLLLLIWSTDQLKEPWPYVESTWFCASICIILCLFRRLSLRACSGVAGQRSGWTGGCVSTHESWA